VNLSTAWPKSWDLPSAEDYGEPFDRLKALSSTEGLSRVAQTETLEVHPELPFYHTLKGEASHGRTGEIFDDGSNPYLYLKKEVS
jgi:hypothetical protein